MPRFVMNRGVIMRYRDLSECPGIAARCFGQEGRGNAPSQPQLPLGSFRTSGKRQSPLTLDSGLCRKVKTMGFLMRCALSSFSFLCNEEIFSISSNLIIQLFFLPSAVKVAFTSAVPFRLTYQSKVVSEVGVTI